MTSHQVERTCRECHSAHAPWEMLIPCKCTGGHIHRTCLDRKRAYRAELEFCSDCGTNYEFELIDDDEKNMLSMLFGLGVARDVSLFLLLCISLIALAGCVLVPALDATYAVRASYFPLSWPESLVNGVCGLILFFVAIGTLVMLSFLLKCLCYQSDCCFFCLYSPYPSPFPYYAGPGPGPCDGGECKGEGNHTFLIVLLLILALVGLLYFCFAIWVVGFSYLNDYRQMMKRYAEAIKLRVRDLDPATMV